MLRESLINRLFSISKRVAVRECHQNFSWSHEPLLQLLKASQTARKLAILVANELSQTGGQQVMLSPVFRGKR